MAATVKYPDYELFRAKFPFIVRNPFNSEIPPGAIMRRTQNSLSGDTNATGQVFWDVGQPDATFERRYLINSPIAIPPFGHGYAGFSGYAYVNGNPQAGEEWGATQGQWYLSQHRPGFVIGASSTKIVNGKTYAFAQGYVVSSVLAKGAMVSPESGGHSLTVYGGTPGSEASISMTISNVYNPGATSTASDLLEVTWLHGKPYAKKLNPITIYKGTAAENIAASASGDVTRDGDGGGTDEVTNYASPQIDAGQAVIYIKIGEDLYSIEGGGT